MSIDSGPNELSAASSSTSRACPARWPGGVGPGPESRAAPPAVAMSDFPFAAGLPAHRALPVFPPDYPRGRGVMSAACGRNG
jgi:hypothetical protein